MSASILREFSFYSSVLKRELSGSYVVDEKGLITVHSAYGSQTTQLGGSRPQPLAQILLRELAEKHFREIGELP